MAVPTTPEAQHDEAAAPVFFPVSQLKFAVMSVVSLGIYQLFWAYQNWRRERDRSGEAPQPFWRALFAPLFTHSLLKRIRAAAEGQGLTVGWSPGFITTGYVLLLLTWRLPGPYGWISIFSFVPLLPVLRTVAALNARAAPSADPNERFTGRNLVLIVIGGLLVLLALFSSFAPEPQDSSVQVRSAAA